MKNLKQDLQATFEVIDVVGEAFIANPYDQTFEEMTEQDMLEIRNALAETGTELTPNEVKESVEIIKIIRNMIREQQT
jgi:uncharacterized protein with HEPN domain